MLVSLAVDEAPAIEPGGGIGFGRILRISDNPRICYCDDIALGDNRNDLRFHFLLNGCRRQLQDLREIVDHCPTSAPMRQNWLN